MALFGRKNGQRKNDGLTSAELQAAELADEVHTVDAVRRQMKPGEQLEFGGPSRCPTCGTLGFIESVNQVKGNSFNFCYTCRNRWMISARAIDASFAHPVDPPSEPVMANPWTIDGYVELEDDLAIEETPAIVAQLADEARVRGELDQPTGENPLIAF